MVFVKCFDFLIGNALTTPLFWVPRGPKITLFLHMLQYHNNRNIEFQISLNSKRGQITHIIEQSTYIDTSIYHCHLWCCRYRHTITTHNTMLVHGWKRLSHHTLCLLHLQTTLYLFYIGWPIVIPALLASLVDDPCVYFWASSKPVSKLASIHLWPMLSRLIPPKLCQTLLSWWEKLFEPIRDCLSVADNSMSAS